MNRTMNDLVIDDVKGGGNGHKLLNCYFSRRGDMGYKFIAGEHERGRNLDVDSEFSFDYEDRNWTLKIKDINSVDGILRGEWKDNGPAESGGGTLTSGADSGDQTFQAQAGTGTFKPGAAKAKA